MGAELIWSVRREVWENRSVYLAPLSVAVFSLIAFLFSTIGMPARRRAVLLLDPEKQRAAIAQPYDAVAVILMLTALVVGAFYCVDALYGERRDRSILFWKSLPVSDRATVLSKIAVPVVVMPLITFAIIVATQLVMFLWTSIVLAGSGLAGTTWSRVNLLRDSVILLYGLTVFAVWYAPVYGWLLLISAWARRAPFLWVALPPMVIAALERMVLQRSPFLLLLKYRLIGPSELAFRMRKGGVVDSLSQLTPGRFLGTAGLWLGLLFAAACVAAAARLRRRRDPI